MIDPSFLNSFLTLTSFKMKTVSSFLDSINKGDVNVFCRFEEYFLPKTDSSRFSTLPSDCLERESCSSGFCVVAFPQHLRSSPEFSLVLE